MEITNSKQLKEVCAQAMKCPSRIIINDQGEARPLRKEDIQQVEVVFVRKDGWSLAAPDHLIEVARKMWDDEWVAVLIKGEPAPVIYKAWMAVNRP